MQQVGLAQEIGDEGGCRRVVDFGGRADLLDNACIHDDDLVGHGQRFFLVVRDEDRGDAGRLLDLLDLDAHFLAHIGVERR